MSQIAFKLKIIKETVILVAFDPQLVRCSAFPQKAVKLKLTTPEHPGLVYREDLQCDF